jgi:hypothetical protein
MDTDGNKRHRCLTRLLGPIRCARELRIRHGQVFGTHSGVYRDELAAVAVGNSIAKQGKKPYRNEFVYADTFVSR